MAVQGFRSILGHRDVIRHLQTAAACGRAAHAYLITGDEGSGKRTIAEAFAETLLCERASLRAEELQKRAAEGVKLKDEEIAGVDACMECLSCRKAADRNHPDILYVTHEKPNVITVSEIREQLVRTVEILPYESRYKIYIVPEADKMNEQAQNALLKTIEEPPGYAVILLLASNPELILPTIHSRCVTLSLLPLRDREVEDYLRRELHLPDYEAHVVASFAQGSIGRALYAAEDEGFKARRTKTFGLIRALKGMDTAAMAEAVRLMKEDRAKIDDVFDLMLMWYRDVLLFKATKEIDQLIFSNEISEIREQAKSASYEGLQEAVAAIGRCRVRLGANVNFELAVELMLTAIKENCNA